MIRIGSLRKGRDLLQTAHRLELILLVCLVANLALFVWTGVATARFPYDWGYGEGPLIDQAARVVAGEALYKATLTEPPYVIANYPPLYPLLIAGIGTVTRLPLLQVGRAVSLAAALVSGLVIGLFAYGLSGRRFSGFVAAAFFLGNPLVMHWSRLARVDLLALALSLMALWVLYRRWQSWPWLTVAVVCLLASIYTRQSYALAAPMAGAIWLWRNDRRGALVFTAALAFSCLFLFGVLNFVTRGGFYLNIVVANVNPYRLDRTLAMMAILLNFCPVVLAVAGVEIVQTVRRHWSKRSGHDGGTTEQPFLFYGLVPYTVGAFLSALTVGKIGSHVNYLLELLAVLAIWAAGALVWWPKGRDNRRRALLLLTLCQVVWMVGGGFWVQSATATRWRDLAQYDALYRQVEAATVRGPVLADDYLGMVVLAGQRIYLQPFEYQQLHTAGMWDPSELVNEIRDRKFPLILITEPGSEICAERWVPSITAAIEDNYEGIEQVHELVVYRPVQ